MTFATRLPKVRYHSEHFNEWTWVCYHQAPPLARVVAHVGDAGQAKPHLEHNPLSGLGTCHATPIRKLNDPGAGIIAAACGQSVVRHAARAVSPHCGAVDVIEALGVHVESA